MKDTVGWLIAMWLVILDIGLVAIYFRLGRLIETIERKDQR